MGYGPIINGKQHPITPYKGSWAEDMAKRRLGPNGELRIPIFWKPK